MLRNVSIFSSCIISINQVDYPNLRCLITRIFLNQESKKVSWYLFCPTDKFLFLFLGKGEFGCHGDNCGDIYFPHILSYILSFLITSPISHLIHFQYFYYIPHNLLDIIHTGYAHNINCPILVYTLFHYSSLT